MPGQQSVCVPSVKFDEHCLYRQMSPHDPFALKAATPISNIAGRREGCYRHPRYVSWMCDIGERSADGGERLLGIHPPGMVPLVEDLSSGKS